MLPLVWGKLVYRICTNGHGFKDRCDGRSVTNYDFAFIGDSFTEAIGMEFEDSFVGRFALESQASVANLAVSSYSPVVYINKVKDVLKRGVRFDHLIVFVDISDLQDDSALYRRGAGGEIVDVGEVMEGGGSGPVLKFVVENFQLTVMAYRLGAQALSSLKPRVIPINLDRSNWTFDPNSPGYGDYGVENAILLSVSYMDELYGILSSQGIKLSVGVYPWPDQIFNDTLKANRQSQIWRTFCENRCEYFIDTFPVFEKLESELGPTGVYEKYFLEGDVHFNKAGNELIFRAIETEFSGNSL